MQPKLKREDILKLLSIRLTYEDFTKACNSFIKDNEVLNSDVMVIRTKNQDFVLQTIVFEKIGNEFIIDLSFIETKEKNVSNKINPKKSSGN